MQRVLTPCAKNIETLAWWEGAFTDEELDILQTKAIAATGDSYIGKGVIDNEMRRTQLDWITNDAEFGWVFDKLAGAVSEINAQYFNFDLTGFGEALQLGNYTAEEQGTYGWHQDFGGAGASRKLTAVLQLSDPADYEGGNLEVLTSKEPESVRKQRGLIISFPCWTVHRVTPVVKGARQTLVAWLSGKPFV